MFEDLHSKPLIEAISRLHLNPDDTLVVKANFRIDRDQAEALKAICAAAIPHITPGRVLVLDSSLELQVITPRPDFQAAVVEAMAEYEQALLDRKYGGIAAGKAIERIQRAIAVENEVKASGLPAEGIEGAGHV